jgi:hypothetical protein
MKRAEQRQWTEETDAEPIAIVQDADKAELMRPIPRYYQQVRATKAVVVRTSATCLSCGYSKCTGSAEPARPMPGMTDKRVPSVGISWLVCHGRAGWNIQAY